MISIEGSGAVWVGYVNIIVAYINPSVANSQDMVPTPIILVRYSKFIEVCRNRRKR